MPPRAMDSRVPVSSSDILPTLLRLLHQGTVLPIVDISGPVCRVARAVKVL